MRQAARGLLIGAVLVSLFSPIAAAETTELSVEAPLKVTGITEVELGAAWLAAWATGDAEESTSEFKLSADRIPYARIRLLNYTSSCSNVLVEPPSPPSLVCGAGPESEELHEEDSFEGPLSDFEMVAGARFVMVARLGDGGPEEAPMSRGLLELATGEDQAYSSMDALSERRYVYATSQRPLWGEPSCTSDVCRMFGIAFEKNVPYVEVKLGTARVSGGSQVYMYGGEITFHDLSKPEARTTTFVSGRTEWTETQNGVPTRQVVAITWITIEDWSGGYEIESQLPMRAFSHGSELVHYKGLLSLKDPTGIAAINQNLTEFAGEDTEIAGEMTILGIDAGSHRSGGTTLTFAVLNDAPPQIPETPPPLTEDEGFARGVVAATAATSSLGLAAYFWPRMKWLLTVPLIPLYTRIAKDEVLEHGKREEIYNLIREEPGIHAHEISSRAQIGWGTTVYHLRMLETNNLVTAQYSGRYKRFFANTGGFAATKDMYAALKNPTTAKIAQEILRNPGITQKEISKAIGITPSLVAWHIGKLEEASLVRRVKEGRLARHYAGDGWKTLNLQLPGTPIGDRSPPGERGAA